MSFEPIYGLECKYDFTRDGKQYEGFATIEQTTGDREFYAGSRATTPDSYTDGTIVDWRCEVLACVFGKDFTNEIGERPTARELKKKGIVFNNIKCYRIWHI